MQICLLSLITNCKILLDKRINAPIYDIALQREYRKYRLDIKSYFDVKIDNINFI